MVPKNLLGILLAGGLDPQDAAWACDILVLLVTAVASEDDVRRARSRDPEGDREHVDEIYTTLSGLPPDRFPLITAHAAQMVAGDGDERFRFAIDIFVDGVFARAAHTEE